MEMEGEKCRRKKTQRVGDPCFGDTACSSATCGGGLCALQELTHVVWLSDRPDATRMRKSRANGAAMARLLPSHEVAPGRRRVESAHGLGEPHGSEFNGDGWRTSPRRTHAGIRQERAKDAEKGALAVERKGRSPWGDCHPSSEDIRWISGLAGAPGCCVSDDVTEAARRTHWQAHADGELGVDATAERRRKQKREGSEVDQRWRNACRMRRGRRASTDGAGSWNDVPRTAVRSCMLQG